MHGIAITIAIASLGCSAAHGPVFDWGAGTSLDCPAGSVCGLKAEYFQMPSYEGRAFNASSLALTRIDPQVSFDWGTAGPDPTLPGVAFMVRWTGFLRIPFGGAGVDTYRFTLRGDDGVRLWVDEQLVIENWTDHQLTENSGDIELTAGTRVPIKLEYYQHQGVASIVLDWSPPGQAPSLIPPAALSPPAEVNGLAATYYTGQAFDVETVNRLDQDVAFSWALDSPDPLVPTDRFSARWIGTIEARTSDVYTFFTKVSEQNEGVRLSINDIRIIDAWVAPFPLESAGSIALEAAQRYPITLEYFETIGAASIELSWASTAQAQTRISWHRLRPPP
jgi:hypothetical protein